MSKKVEIVGPDFKAHYWFDFLPRVGDRIIEGKKIWKVTLVAHYADFGMARISVQQDKLKGG